MVDGIDAAAETFGALVDSQQAIEVPLYQRAFNWRAENIEALWTDLVETRSVPQEQQSLFLGPIVFHHVRRPDQTIARHLVDGQQRITTISLILAALRNRLKQAPDVAAGALLANINRYLFKVDAKTQALIDPPSEKRLRLSKKDDRQYEELLRSGKVKGKNTLLRKAWKTINELIDEEIRERLGKGLDDEITDVEAREAVSALAHEVHFAVGTVAVFARIRVENPFDPLAVFESLNSKSLPLAPSDLIKNLLVQRSAPASKQEDVAAEWDRLAEQVNGDVVGFLRSWFIAEFRHVQKRHLFAQISEVVPDDETVQERLALWNNLAPWYSALSEGRPAPVKNVSQQEAVRAFHMTGFRQGIPILLALITRGRLDLVQEAAHILETYYIRVNKTANVRGSVFEKEVPRICAAVRESPEDGLHTLRTNVRNLILRYSADLDWTHLRLTGKNLQRYVLVKLARVQQGHAYAAPPADELEIEHIMPQVPGGDWREDESDSYVNHIGNLTLILTHDNKRCGNRSFVEKQQVYSEYDGESHILEIDGQMVSMRKHLFMTHELAMAKTWGPVQIEDRARKLAAMANEAWPLPAAPTKPT